VSAGARASPSWIGGRRRPTVADYALTERMRKLTDFEQVVHEKWTRAASRILEVAPVVRGAIEPWLSRQFPWRKGE
jgi:hypothetical protein